MKTCEVCEKVIDEDVWGVQEVRNGSLKPHYFCSEEHGNYYLQLSKNRGKIIESNIIN